MRFGKSLVLVLAVMAAASQAAARQPKAVAMKENATESRELILDPIYIRPDGAIKTFTSGNLIDPYFPTKSLLVALDNGMDVTTLANNWISWMLTKQDYSGLFNRYCVKSDNVTYENCGVADADDAMLAMWIELLYRMAPKGGLPDEWKVSAEKAEYQLNTLFSSKDIVFYISKDLQAGLLMDNIEIYSSFKRIEREAIRLGDGKKSVYYKDLAEYLKKGIIGRFWDPKNKRFIASTQKREDTSFYPDTVVQLIPMMHNFIIPHIQSYSVFYKQWMKHHRDEWFALIGNDYPWGLLAVYAQTRNDEKTSHCWLQQATPYRNTNLWNVLDETAFQIIDWKLEKKNLDIDPECLVDNGI